MSKLVITISSWLPCFYLHLQNGNRYKTEPSLIFKNINVTLNLQFILYLYQVILLKVYYLCINPPYFTTIFLYILTFKLPSLKNYKIYLSSFLSETFPSVIRACSTLHKLFSNLMLNLLFDEKPNLNISKCLSNGCLKVKKWKKK